MELAFNESLNTDPPPQRDETASALPLPSITISEKIIIPKKKTKKIKLIVAANETQKTEETSHPPPPPIYKELELTPQIKIIKGDCLEVMKTIKDSSIHLILCDLPYGTTKCKWDSIIDIDVLWKEYRRILVKPSGVIVLFGQQPFTTKLISGNYEWFKYNIIWKKNKTTQYLLANYRPMKCTEDICVFSPGGAAAASRVTGNMTYNPQGLTPVNIKKKNSEKRIGKMLNQLHHLGKNNKLTSDTEYKQSFTNYPTEIIEFDIEYDTIHETQKPVPLIEFLIKTYSNEENMVLDNTMGSGTTGIGCINTNRQFMGIELEDKYFVLSKSRLEEAIKKKEPQNTVVTPDTILPEQET